MQIERLGKNWNETEKKKKNNSALIKTQTIRGV